MNELWDCFHIDIHKINSYQKINGKPLMLLIQRFFSGNTDQNTVVYHDLNPPITARYIRFKPVEWQDQISMRVELYGCVQGKA